LSASRWRDADKVNRESSSPGFVPSHRAGGQVYGLRCKVYYVLWFLVHGEWLLVNGLWCIICGLWFVVYGLWFMVYILWFMVCG